MAKTQTAAYRFIGKPVDSECFYGYHARCSGCNCTCHLPPAPPVAISSQVEGATQTASRRDDKHDDIQASQEPSWITALCENSKRDDYIIVGSDIRKLVGEIRRLKAALRDDSPAKAETQTETRGMGRDGTPLRRCQCGHGHWNKQGGCSVCDCTMYDPVNQCEGCRLGLPVEGGYHINRDKPGWKRTHMFCSKTNKANPRPT